MKTIKIDALYLLRETEACSDGIIEFLDHFREGFSINSRKSLESAVRKALKYYSWEDAFEYLANYDLENYKQELEDEAYDDADEENGEDFYGDDLWEELPWKKRIDILWEKFVHYHR